MGVVYVCYDHKFKEVLALKTFKGRLDEAIYIISEN